MSDVVILVEELSKKFCRSLKRSMYYGTINLVKSALGIKINTNKLKKKEFWALDNINFQIKRGEKVGIIGPNGSGKSTLLRLLTGILPPDKGKIIVKGRVSPLIAVGAGFHPHMSGRENIYLNGTILGMTKKEIENKFNKIIEFAEIGDFIDSPVSTYSSGMYVRLGFAIAIHSNPEIIIADEVLSVGDLMFQIKCYDKLNEIISRGCTVILVSHSEVAIRSVCERVIILDKGKLVDIGETNEMILKYRSIMLRDKMKNNNKKIKNASTFIDKTGTLTLGHAKFKSIEIRDKNNILIRKDKTEYNKIKFSKENKLKVIFKIEIFEEIKKPIISFYLRDMSKSEISYVFGIEISSNELKDLELLKKGNKQIEFEVDINGLAPNIYSVYAGIGDEKLHYKLYDYIKEIDNITLEIVKSDEYKSGPVLVNKPYYIPKFSYKISDIYK